MEFFLRGLNDDFLSSNQDISRCPFLRNINEPTNFSFSHLPPFQLPVRTGKGPIFEDGPNFDAAFRLFHGRDGVVPLSERKFSLSENEGLQATTAVFNPLAAKAATISLSSFGCGVAFSFDSLAKFNKNKKNSKSSEGRYSNHDSYNDEWLQTGHCPIAKSYRAVSNVLPLVAKVFQPHVTVAARATMARTALAKSLKAQPLPTKVLVIGMLGMALNVPLGIWKEHTKKFSVSWFVAVHAAVPFISVLRKSVLMPKATVAFTVAASILGQIIGSRAEQHRMKVASKNQPLLLHNAFDQSIELQMLQHSKAFPVVTANSSGDVFC